MPGRQRGRARSRDALHGARRPQRAGHPDRAQAVRLGRAHLTLPSTSCSTGPAKPGRRSARPAAASDPPTRTSTDDAVSGGRSAEHQPGERAGVRAVQAANEFLELLGSTERADAGEHVACSSGWPPRLLPLAVDADASYGKRSSGENRCCSRARRARCWTWTTAPIRYVTSSNTTAGGAAVGAGSGPTAIDAVLGVVKAYTTRVGNGPLPTEAPPALAERIRELGDEFGATTGRPRRCAGFDAVVVRYDGTRQRLTGLAVTKLDVLDSLRRFRLRRLPVRWGGTRLDACRGGAPARVEPLYETLPGWQKSLSHVRPARGPTAAGPRLPRSAPGPGGTRPSST